MNEICFLIISTYRALFCSLELNGTTTLLFKLENKDLVLALVAAKCSFLPAAVVLEGGGVAVWREEFGSRPSAPT